MEPQENTDRALISRGGWFSYESTIEGEQRAKSNQPSGVQGRPCGRKVNVGIGQGEVRVQEKHSQKAELPRKQSSRASLKGGVNGGHQWGKSGPPS